MDNPGRQKFENPARLAELDPAGTLINAGFGSPMTLCDIGAGSGVFTFAAAALTGGAVYALEKSDDMLNWLRARADHEKRSNVIIKRVSSDELPLDSGVCDLVLMVTVFHEIDRRDAMLSEIKRIITQTGKLLIIDFHKGKTPMGPPAHHRLAEEEALSLCLQKGFSLLRRAPLGDNFYSLLFEAE